MAAEPFTIAFTGPRDRRRIRYEPDGTGGWLRIHQVHTGTSWRTVGREPVEELAVEGAVP